MLEIIVCTAVEVGAQGGWSTAVKPTLEIFRSAREVGVLSLQQWSIGSRHISVGIDAGLGRRVLCWVLVLVST